jgi:NAD-dependent SIR2 family protein deacetylase
MSKVKGKQTTGIRLGESNNLYALKCSDCGKFQSDERMMQYATRIMIEPCDYCHSNHVHWIRLNS